MQTSGELLYPPVFDDVNLHLQVQLTLALQNIILVFGSEENYFLRKLFFMKNIFPRKIIFHLYFQLFGRMKNYFLSISLFAI